MMRIGLAALMAAVLTVSFVALAAGFPLDKGFKAVSISGFDVQKSGLTLTVMRTPGGLKGSGSAGCNRWTASVTVRDDQIDITEIVTTRMRCAKPRMTTEEAFLTSLKSARRWRQDGARLILDGEAARLLFTAATPGAENRTPGKPAKPARPAPAQPRR